MIMGVVAHLKEWRWMQIASRPRVLCRHRNQENRRLFGKGDWVSLSVCVKPWSIISGGRRPVDSWKRQPRGQRDGSGVEALAAKPDGRLNCRNTHGRRRGPTQESCPLTATGSLRCVFVNTHMSESMPTLKQRESQRVELPSGAG